jgi:4-diphosphocytidyl-2-C-methyl-D-erythritol kinase
VRPLDKDAGNPPRLRFCDASGGIIPDIDPDNNTLTRAWQWHARHTGFAPALDIRVEKNAPRGAGLGGGSANAATLLRLLQRLALASGLPAMNEETLVAGSAAIGADVPFFLVNRPARAFGVGERLRPAANPFAGCRLTLVCPAERISTAWAFAELDRMRQSSPAPRLNENAPLPVRPDEYANDFEPVVFRRYPALADLHAGLVRTGPLLARLSGTGSSLFALYRDEENARQAAKALASRVLSVYTQRLPG